jgi:ubiquinone/menaquinone biosynthesis C-methylase UbiE
MTKDECSKKEDVNKHYDIQWEGYSNGDILTRVANLIPVIDPIIYYLPKNENIKVLDLGCGPAVIPLRIAQRKEKDSKLEIFGIDISQKALKLAGSLISKDKMDFIHLILGDCESLPFCENSFDCIVSNVTFNLLVDKKSAFSEMERALKEDGILVIGDCIKEEDDQSCQDSNDDSDLWSQCVAGAPSKSDMLSYARSFDLEVLDIRDLTETVKEIVKNGSWDWPEFLDHDLKYHVFVFRKSMQNK